MARCEVGGVCGGGEAVRQQGGRAAGWWGGGGSGCSCEVWGGPVAGCEVGERVAAVAVWGQQR